MQKRSFQPVLKDVTYGSDSEESSTSFHSLTEQFESLNAEELEFTKSESVRNKASPKNMDSAHESSTLPNNSKKDVHTNPFFDLKEDLNVEPSKKEDKYFVDEDVLKELEKNILEEDKLKRRQKAVEKKIEGNVKFKEYIYEEAACIYTEGLKLCPLSCEKERAILYANRAAARSKLDEEQKKGSIEDCDKAISLDPSYLKAIQRRANLHRQLGNLEEALKDYQRVLEIEPRNAEAVNALMVLPKQIEERNEKLKAEMLGKLKDLGNMILKPFGLSTENFELNQNSGTGGYTININQQPS